MKRVKWEEYRSCVGKQEDRKYNIKYTNVRFPLWTSAHGWQANIWMRLEKMGCGREAVFLTIGLNVRLLHKTEEIPWSSN